MEHAFASEFTVGVEEELFLVDPPELGLSHEAERLLPAIERSGAGRPTTRPSPARSSCAHRRWPRRARPWPSWRLPGPRLPLAGATTMGAGLHPSAELFDVQLVHQERYAQVEDSMRGLIKRTPECALHVHVGMPGVEAAVRAFNGLREWLPVLQALTANSPWWFGQDSGKWRAPGRRWCGPTPRGASRGS